MLAALVLISAGSIVEAHWFAGVVASTPALAAARTLGAVGEHAAVHRGDGADLLLRAQHQRFDSATSGRARSSRACCGVWRSRVSAGTCAISRASACTAPSRASSCSCCGSTSRPRAVARRGTHRRHAQLRRVSRQRVRVGTALGLSARTQLDGGTSTCGRRPSSSRAAWARPRRPCRPAGHCASRTIDPPKPPPVMPRAEDAALGARNLHHAINLRDGRVVADQQRHVRGVQRRTPQARDVALAQGVDGREHACVLGDDVAGPPLEQVRQHVEAAQVGLGHLAQFVHAQRLRGSVALPGGAGERHRWHGCGDPRVDDRDLGRGRDAHELPRQVARVEEERVVHRAEGAGDGVHDANRHADEVGFDAPRESGEHDVVDGQLEQVAQDARSVATTSDALDDRPLPRGTSDRITASKPPTA